MDHRVSKDMISQGMSVTGEKTTEDLNSTQIGKVATPHNMRDAYQSIYEKKENIDEEPISLTLGALAAKAGGAIAAKTAAAGGAKAVAGKVAGSAAKQAVADKAVSTVLGGGKKKTEEGVESNPDDLIQELKASGLFSEEELKEVLGTLTNADKKGNTPAWQNKDKKGKDGNPLYKMADHLKSPKLTTAPVKKY